MATPITHRFDYAFVDEADRKITFEYSPEYDEELATASEDGRTLLSVNPTACVALAKVLIKLALGSYPNGYRVYIRQNFDGNLSDALIVELRKV